jgi:hypothetical protein
VGLATCTSDSQAITAVSVQTGCLGCDTVLSRCFHLHGNSYISVATFLLTRGGFVLLFTTPGSEFILITLTPKKEATFFSETLVFTYKTMVTAYKQQWEIQGLSAIQVFANISEVTGLF